MAIPDHEKLKGKGHPPHTGTGQKPGQKSSEIQILKRVIQVGQMMDVQGMSMTEIYQWNQEPEQAKDWGFSVHSIHRLCARARRLGVDILGQSYNQRVRTTYRQYYALYRKAVAGDDFRVALACIMRLEKLRGINPDKIQAVKTDQTTGASFDWNPLPPPEPMDGIFTDVKAKDLLERPEPA